MWCKMLRKALWNFKVKMKSAWIQHDFSMNSTWIQHPAPAPQPNLHQNLGKNLQFKTKSQNHWNMAWIQQESDMNLTWMREYNVTRLNMHEFSMNPAWIQHENTMLQPKYLLKLPNFSRFSAAFWIGGCRYCTTSICRMNTLHSYVIWFRVSFTYKYIYAIYVIITIYDIHILDEDSITHIFRDMGYRMLQWYLLCIINVPCASRLRSSLLRPQKL